MPETQGGFDTVDRVPHRRTRGFPFEARSSGWISSAQLSTEVAEILELADCGRSPGLHPGR